MDFVRLVVVGLVVSAELGVGKGPRFELPIVGMDPRDPLHGQNLQYQFDLRWEGASSCGETDRPTPGCCLCLNRREGSDADPSVQQVSCETRPRCDGWIRAETLEAPLRYFIPEEHAPTLEDAIGTHAASLEVFVRADGSVAFGFGSRVEHPCT